jgi:hypothetical protein
MILRSSMKSRTDSSHRSQPLKMPWLTSSVSPVPFLGVLQRTELCIDHSAIDGVETVLGPGEFSSMATGKPGDTDRRSDSGNRRDNHLHDSEFFRAGWMACRGQAPEPVSVAEAAAGLTEIPC